MDRVEPRALPNSTSSCSLAEQQPPRTPAHEHDHVPLPALAYDTCEQQEQSERSPLSVPDIILHTSIPTLSAAAAAASSSSHPSSVPSLTYDSVSLDSPLLRSMVHEPLYIDRWLRALEEMESQPSITDKQQYNLHTIRQHITHGVNLDLVDGVPPALVYSNSPSVAQHSDAVRVRLAEYMAWGAVVQLPSAPERIQPLLVIIKPGRKPRLCIDLSRNLNDFISVPHFSYTNVSHAVKLSQPGCWYSKLDLSNCYLSFHLHPDAVTHFAFAFEGKYYTFTRMPFGLSSAPFFCTQLLSVVAYQLRKQGIALVRYLDDFLLISATRAEAERDLLIAQRVFRWFGLVVNPDKTEGPAQSLSFLGVQIDSVKQTLCVTEERMHELQQLLSDFLVTSRRTASAHALMSLVGKLSFAAACLPGARPFMRRVLDLVPHGRPKYKLVNLSSSFRADLLYWSTRLRLWNGRCSWIRPEPIVLVSDASIEGFGFHLHSLPAGFDESVLPAALKPGSGVLGVWSKCHRPLVATHRQIQWAEMFAALAALLTYSPYVGRSSVLLRMDNMSDVGAINRQSSRSSTVCLLVRAMFDLSFRYHFAFRAEHIPGATNYLADFLSRPSMHQHRPLLTWPLQPVDPSAAVWPALSAVTVLLSSDVKLLELTDNAALPTSSTPLCQPSSSSPFVSVPGVHTRLTMPTTCAGARPSG